MPLQTFLEEFVQFLLRYFVFQLCRTLLVGHAQQYTVVIFFNLKKPDIASAWNKAVIVAVDIAVKLVIACVKAAIGLEQAHFVNASHALKNLNGLGGVALNPLERYVTLHNAAHPLAHGSDLLFAHGNIHAAVVPL